MLLQSSLVYFLAKLVPSALALLNSALLTRVLSVRDFGLYGLGLSIIAIVGSVGFDWIGSTYCRFFQSGDTSNDRLQSSVTFIYLAMCLGS
ncbi:MAG: hypothetical protein JO069_10815, partial [Verrucomicrobia bacterium]|nr:hypothetical protein [Verrucomicrobiota bacterium]